MKKTYQNPETKVVLIEVQQNLLGGSTTDQVTVGESVGDANGAEARHHSSIWDDDEE